MPKPKTVSALYHPRWGWVELVRPHPKSPGVWLMRFLERYREGRAASCPEEGWGKIEDLSHRDPNGETYEGEVGA